MECSSKSSSERSPRQIRALLTGPEVMYNLESETKKDLKLKKERLVLDQKLA
jgi:hypothetical protein